VMAEEAKEIDALLVHYSTDYVFDGTRTQPYVEDDEPNPINVYGKTKLEGERAIVASGCLHFILRASWIYSSRGTNFVLTILRLARERQELAVVNDQIGSPTWARALADSSAELLGKVERSRNESGVYHLAASGYASRYEFTRKIIETAKQLSGTTSGWATVRPISSAEYPLPAARPLNCATNKERINEVFGVRMPTWTDQLSTCLRERFDKNI
jgi:dTDP-4-dehydrorhamnose reductase